MKDQYQINFINLIQLHAMIINIGYIYNSVTESKKDELPYASKLIDYLANRISQTEDLDLLFGASKDVGFNFIQGLDMGLKVFSTLMEKYRPFKMKVYYDIYEYFKAQLDNDPEDFLDIILPPGFEKENEKHVEWVLYSLEQQLDEALRNLTSLISSSPVIIKEIEKLNLKDKIYNKATQLYDRFKSEIKLKNEETNEEIQISHWLDSLPRDFKKIGKSIINSFLEKSGNSLFNTPMLESIPRIYMDSFDNLLTYTLRPIISAKTDLEPTEVMNKTAYSIIQDNKNHLPQDLHYLLDVLEPKIRNAVAHKNYIIDKELQEMSYFQPPYYNRRWNRTYDLNFDLKVDLNKLWLDTLVISITQMMFSFMKYHYMMNYLNESITSDDRLTYMLWKPESRLKGDVFGVLLTFKLLAQQPAKQVGKRRELLPTLETGLLELIIITDQDFMNSKILTRVDNNEDVKGNFLENVKNNYDTDFDLVLAYLLYLLGTSEDPNEYDQMIENALELVEDEKEEQFRLELNLAREREAEKSIDDYFDSLESELEGKLNMIQEKFEQSKETETLEKIKSILPDLRDLYGFADFKFHTPYASEIRLKSLRKSFDIK